MKIAIIHYHLHPGGVTRIIASQVSGLSRRAENAEIKILCGDSHTEYIFSNVQVIQDNCLLYDETDDILFGLEAKTERMKNFIIHHAKNFVLHCHNPNLGKNPVLTLAVYQLAKQGFKIVNHCHDFAEDRPGNMERLNRAFDHAGLTSSEVLYPDLPGYHYVVLNSCDYDRVLKNGISPLRIHLLPNPVSINSRRNSKRRADIIARLGLQNNKKIITYPVRAIRRKNIGEFILMAVIFKDTCQFNITQAPKNPVEIPLYLQWKRFCEENRIDVKFETGVAVNHEDLIGISDFCITTSIREGFGMVYLEPWLAGTPVTGRNLPCITDDLWKYGLEFPPLYNHIQVKTSTGNCDYRELETAEQENLILRLLGSTHEIEILLSLNPFLNTLFNDVEPEMIRKNRKLIRKYFSVDNYGKRLFALYKSVSR